MQMYFQLISFLNFETLVPAILIGIRVVGKDPKDPKLYQKNTIITIILETCGKRKAITLLDRGSKENIRLSRDYFTT